MLANQHAFGDPALLAPVDFRRALKAAFPDNGDTQFDCWFNPRGARTERGSLGQPTVQNGVWCIWMRVRRARRGDVGMGKSVDVAGHSWVNVFDLNGAFENPTTPGRWAIQALLASDMTRLVNRQRKKMLDDANEADILEQQRIETQMQLDIEKDKVWRNILRSQDEKFGKETQSGDQKLAMHRRRYRDELKTHNKALKLAKSKRFYGTR